MTPPSPAAAADTSVTAERPAAAVAAPVPVAMGRMDRLLRLMAEKHASDLFIAPGSPVQIKINGVIMPVNRQPLDPPAVESLARELVDVRDWAEFERKRELNAPYVLRGVGSFRVNLFRQRGSTSSVIRFVPHDIPAFETLNLPSVLLDLVMEKRGLVLVVGATGSGKSTTLASMIDHRNTHRSGHILTLADPIEFTFSNKRSIVSQRQLGTDTESLEIALRSAMRQAPDCILIGDIRDAPTMAQAIAYSQSGHLVLATMHANNANHALNRIVSFYGPENRHALLADLSASLRAIFSQRLLKTPEGGRVPAVELLLNTRHIAELIETGRLTEVKEAMEKSLAPGSETFDQAIVKLLRGERVSREEALANADSPTNLLWMLENAGDGSRAPMSRAGLPTIDESVLPAAPGPGPGPGPDRARRDEGPSFSDFLLNI